MADYRETLIDTQIRLNENYDKLIVTLSGGALALSVAFLKDIIALKNIVFPHLLLFSWGLFIFSLAAILVEIIFGIKAYKTAIKQVDNQNTDEKLGGKSASLSVVFHWAAAISLLTGLFSLFVFAYLNIGVENG